MISAKKIIIILPLLLLAACRSVEYVEVPTVKVVRDTITDTRIQRDSVYLSDRIYIQGDTVYRDRWHYRERTRIDSVYITHTDTITIPRIIYRDRDKPQPWHARIFEGIGMGALAILAAWVVTYIIRRRILR